jgi:hypothetical protein
LLDSATHTWRKLSVTGAKIPPYYAEFWGAVYDSKRDRVLFTGAEPNTLTQMWALDFRTMILDSLSPSGSPLFTVDRRCREMVYLPQLDIVLIQGKLGTANRIYNCETNSWESHTITASATTLQIAGIDDMSSHSSGYFYDAKRDLVWNSQGSEILVLKLTKEALNPTKAVKNAAISGKNSISAEPNPFNPSIKINMAHFAETGKHPVLYVLSIDGRLISRLAMQKTGNNFYSVTWNGRDILGKRVAPGVYICTVDRIGHTQSIKIVLSE